MLKNTATHYVIIDNNLNAPKIRKFNIVLLIKIEFREFMEMDSGNYMGVFIDGTKDFFRGIRSDKRTWIMDLNLDILPRPQKQIESVYKVVHIFKGRRGRAGSPDISILVNIS
ncbi:hypothetical protein CLV51_11070 [Chitinophaga niastensis]|uniref:Uncharacterized protein n=1 Tax=Chitinophaga niastensis TaxID=536980 RepID=A0A2P8H9H2_CHINA|nr:hypothetical protein [Chitinophaga niastensis]PSL42854.1 hypothetical protein CLV51_11070 [Chitinophaga niastensis]